MHPLSLGNCAANLKENPPPMEKPMVATFPYRVKACSVKDFRSDSICLRNFLLYSRVRRLVTWRDCFCDSTLSSLLGLNLSLRGIFHTAVIASLMFWGVNSCWLWE